MAVFREEPKCPYCGKQIMKAIYEDRPNFFGDSFSHWEQVSHICWKQIRLKIMKSLKQNVK